VEKRSYNLYRPALIEGNFIRYQLKWKHGSQKFVFGGGLGSIKAFGFESSSSVDVKCFTWSYWNWKPLNQ
jgi:hypothetical protein